jgi:putative selenate reductase
VTSPLTPYPLHLLLGRIVHEWGTRHRIFDMPSGRFHHVDPDLDLSVTVGRRPAATPIGPAAGPHTQMAQNIVLGWLAGARTFELKTVQILDELEIPRPCIDMEGEGYNVEWSQELRIAQSLEEYAKAWMMIRILGEWGELHPLLGDPGPHVFDMSVGYDLAGITSEPMTRFVEGLLDATELIDRLRPQIPEPFGAWREAEFPPRVVTGVTLSTFHGCPPEEIEAIVRHLIDRFDLDVVVKLNPTLLGIDPVRTLLDGLGYGSVRLDPGAFGADLQYDRALTMISGLHRHAEERGRTLGIKLTNTLVVGNDRGVLPGDTMYLSGPPLHVIAATLLDRLDADLPGLLGLGPEPGPVQVSFSAGIDRTNVAEAVALGLAPVTVCTALLKPGGYGNLSGMLRSVATTMHDAGCPDVAAWIQSAHDRATAGRHRNAVAAHAAAVSGSDGVRRYGRAANPTLREVDRDLEVWDCVSCNLCVTVCPNDAMLHLASPEGGGFEEKWQYFCLAELCNDCGNCVTFCPERGDPSRVKPRLFFDEKAFRTQHDQGYLVTAPGSMLLLEPSAAAKCQDLDRIKVFVGGSEGFPFRADDLG